MPKSTLFLIDAHALCYRSYFAIRGLATSRGQATNAVYGFVNTLKKIMKDFSPTYMAVCFDVSKKTHRQEKYAEYKIQRPRMPDDLVTQIPIIKKVVAAYKLPVFELEGFEADDVIATLAHKMPKKGIDVVIVSDDKDMLQLVNDNVKVFSTRKDKFFDSDGAKERMGIAPAHIVDFIGLAGDKTDNIPGVMGVGEVTAKNLINEFGDVESIYKNLENIKSAKVREKLENQKDMAFFSKELAILEKDVPFDFKLTDMKVEAPDNKSLFELFKELEFRKFAQEVSGEEKVKKTVKVHNVQKKKDMDSLLSQIKKKGEMAFLIQQNEENQSVEMSISLNGKDAYDLDADFLKDIKVIFEDEKILKITHDIKEAMKVLASEGIDVRGEIFDSMLAGYLIVPGHTSYDIETLGWMFSRESVSQEDALTQKVSCVFNMFSVAKKELKEKSLSDLFEKVEIPLARVLFLMEANGVTLDLGLLERLSKDCNEKIKSLEKEVYKIAGEEFNLNSPKQLSKVLFEKLKLPVIKKTKTGFSTDEGVLKRLAIRHALPALVLDYRQFAKLKSTYIDALPKLVDIKTNRLHAYFNQTGTETGRLSSSNPNLQNIPIRTDFGRQIRKAFVSSDKNNVLIAADYSQVELRVLAHLSDDKTLIKAFKDGEDIHDYTASLIFDVKEKDVTPDMRNSAKRVNFGIIYGMSAFGLAKDLDISQGTAQEFIDKYFLRYPNVKKFMDNEIRKCEEEGYVVTLMNRRRYIPEINNRNVNVKQFAERQAINTPVQGSAADLMKLAMINIQKEIEKKKLSSKMTITVHDELVFDSPEKEQKELISIIRDKMENALKLSVPVKVSIKCGQNWLDMKEVA